MGIIQLPYDIYKHIMYYFEAFQVAEAQRRLYIFRYNCGTVWQKVMSEILMNIPRYNMRIIAYDDTILHLSIFEPDCDLSGFNVRADFNSWRYFHQPAALSTHPDALQIGERRSAGRMERTERINIVTNYLSY
jgi:hypothetical protein